MSLPERHRVAKVQELARVLLRPDNHLDHHHCHAAAVHRQCGSLAEHLWQDGVSLPERHRVAKVQELSRALLRPDDHLDHHHCHAAAVHGQCGSRAEHAWHAWWNGCVSLPERHREARMQKLARVLLRTDNHYNYDNKGPQRVQPSRRSQHVPVEWQVPAE